ncbi:MAG: Ig-like domain-containing protein [Bacteroidales bacterium]|nr:Ig-like domain-containing protein [Bacteroidales bacterium]
MKKQLFGLMTILTMLNACQKNEVSVSLPEEATIHATIEDKDATKTVKDESNNILWSENDQIIAFMKSSYGHKYQVKPSFVGKSYADFSMVSSGNSSDLSAGNEWDHNVVYYPYSEDIECIKSGSNYELEVNLPSEQVYVPDSFANGSMAMIAVSESNNITFKNVLGGIKLQLKGTQMVKSIKIEGKNSEKLSGAAIVTAYTDDTKPAITMDSGASKSVTLNCSNGVQLNESKATEFIISLPPILFSKGFTITVTDSENETYTVETDKANTILRSSLLVMPAFRLGHKPSDDYEDDSEIIIPVSYIDLNHTKIKLYEGGTAHLTATVGPRDATNKVVVWNSNDATIATVDQNGLVTAILAGKTIISATAGGQTNTCSIEVSPIAIATVDYIDEYGINYGKGTAIGKVVWAPVNCGYHSTDFLYGKLYQWGRRYGQGYSGNLFDKDYNKIGEHSDALLPTIEVGDISVITANHKNNANVFYTCTSKYGNDWVDPRDDKLWNSGTEDNPIKTEYDPCPTGWRVPTSDEARELKINHSSLIINDEGVYGCWFSGPFGYTATANKIFLPAAGYRYDDSGNTNKRGYYGCYWTSCTYAEWSYYLGFSNSNSGIFDGYRSSGRASGFSIRCVQE